MTVGHQRSVDMWTLMFQMSTSISSNFSTTRKYFHKREHFCQNCTEQLSYSINQSNWPRTNGQLADVEERGVLYSVEGEWKAGKTPFICAFIVLFLHFSMAYFAK